MERPPARPSPADEHWAPDHIVLSRHVLTSAGRLIVERDSRGEVRLTAPLAGMAAVEQRYPPWALGPFGRIEPERSLPSSPGVYALVQAGTVRYVGASRDLARTFSRDGLGEISRRDCQNPAFEEPCRLNRLVSAEARAGRTVDLYVLVTGDPRHRLRSVLSRGPDAPTALAAEIAEVAHGTWHLPT